MQASALAFTIKPLILAYFCQYCNCSLQHLQSYLVLGKVEHVFITQQTDQVTGAKFAALWRVRPLMTKEMPGTKNVITAPFLHSHN
jgi:hypothetical protein